MKENKNERQHVNERNFQCKIQNAMIDHVKARAYHCITRTKHSACHKAHSTVNMLSAEFCKNFN